MSNVWGPIMLGIEQYYTSKLAEYGLGPKGVDWNGSESQFIRFAQLGRVFDGASPNFSVNDLGCGYGAFVDYLQSSYTEFTYKGYDLSSAMIDAAQARYKNGGKISFRLGAQPLETADYGVASGIFNVRLKATDTEWLEYILETIEALNRTSRFGFSFNCLTSYADKEKKRDYLYYADPCYLFDRCKKFYSRQVALLHDYNLYDFTIVVRKEGGS